MSVVQSWVHPVVSMASFDPWMASCKSRKICVSKDLYPTLPYHWTDPMCFSQKKNRWNVMPSCWKRRTRCCFQPIIVASMTPPYPIKVSTGDHPRPSQTYPLAISHMEHHKLFKFWFFLTLNLWLRLNCSSINGYIMNLFLWPMFHVI